MPVCALLPQEKEKVLAVICPQFHFRDVFYKFNILILSLSLSTLALPVILMFREGKRKKLLFPRFAHTK